MNDPVRSPTPALDVDQLAGFHFSCRPDCGLCCFTSPRLERADEVNLLRMAPEARIRVDGAVHRVPSRPEGGACQFLTDLRCSVHDARPAPCREFPVIVHIGTRLQASLVLSCPGLELGRLSSPDPGRSFPPGSGLERELESVAQRINSTVERRAREAVRRRRSIVRELVRDDRWVDDAQVREELRRGRLSPSPEEFSPTLPPSAEDPVELLPLFYDGRPGPVALAEAWGGWQALEVAPEGGARSLGVLVPPSRAPELDPAAARLLEGYLRYFLDRDCFLAAVHLEMLGRPSGNVLEAAHADLRAIGSDVMARAAVRAKLRGEDGSRLTSADVERGIRATDQDWLDRPTWGSRL